MHPVSPTHSQVAEHSFDRIVMHLDTAILQKHLEGLLVIKYIVDCSLNHCTIRRIKLDLLQQLHQLANDRCTVLKSKSASLLSCMLAYLRLSLYLEEVVHHQDDYTHTMVRDISIHEAMAGMEPASCTHQSHSSKFFSIVSYKTALSAVNTLIQESLKMASSCTL